MKETADVPDVHFPPPLQKGDTIGLVAPASPWEEEAFAKGVNIISQFGFEVRFSRELTQREEYLAGTDQHRSTIFNEIWRDEKVKAVLAVRGGYGCLRILPFVDFSLIKAQPKCFIGFSDITALHSAIGHNTGLVTFHGPMLTTLGKSDRQSVHSFFDTLTQGMCQPIKSSSLEILKPGNAAGRTAGGNLATAVHLIATPYEASWQNKIVLLEDIGEAPYRIDRLLTHLHAAGRFNNISGLILGSFTGCGKKELIWSRVLDLFRNDTFPIWANFPFGHGEQNMMIPMGAEARMDSATGLLSFPDPEVSR